MNALLPEQIEQLRAVLSQRLAGMQDAPGVAAADTPRGPAVDEVETSPADSASNRTMNDLALESEALRQNQLRAVRAALNRIESGDYGLCEQCGQPIGFARLAATPEARFCIACQTRLEQGRR